MPRTRIFAGPRCVHGDLHHTVVVGRLQRLRARLMGVPPCPYKLAGVLVQLGLLNTDNPTSFCLLLEHVDLLLCICSPPDGESLRFG